MVIKNEMLKKLLKKNGRKKVLYMYIHEKIHLKSRQLSYVLDYVEK